MIKRLFTLICLICFVTSLSAHAVTPKEEIPTHYSSIDGTAAEELFSQLTKVTNAGYVALSYSGLWDAYTKTDVDDNNHIIDMYSNCTFSPGKKSEGGDQCGNYRNECDCYNREHSVPKSWFGSLEKEIGADVFHVVPTDGKVNSYRSNYAFGVVASGDQVGTCKVGSSVSTIHNDKKTISAEANTNTSAPSGKKVFEPSNQYKGDFARGYFGTIMKWNTKYKMTSDGGSTMFNSSYTKSANYGLTPYAVALLMKWHRDDPVSEKEIKRNNGIEEKQGNRNPFIDYPYLAEYIWGERSGQAVQLSHMISSSDSRFVPGRSDGWDGSTDVEEVSAPTPTATKYILNGQVIIERNGVRYNMMGQRVE